MGYHPEFFSCQQPKKRGKSSFWEKIWGREFLYTVQASTVDKCIYALKMQPDATKTSAINDSRACPQRIGNNIEAFTIQYVLTVPIK